MTLGSLLNFSELLVCNIHNNNTLLEIFGGFKEMKNVNFSAQDRTVFKFAHSETQSFELIKELYSPVARSLNFLKKKKKKLRLKRKKKA